MTNPSSHTLNKPQRLLAPGITQSGLAHELDDLPRREAVRILRLLRPELIQVRLQRQEVAPFGLVNQSGSVAQEQLHQETDCVGQNSRIEEFEDLAFVLVVRFPCFGLTGLVRRVSLGGRVL